MGKKVEDKLKPCPFCGPFKKGAEHNALKPKLFPWEHGYLVRCGNCPASMRVQTRFKIQAAATWNCREGKIDLTL